MRPALLVFLMLLLLVEARGIRVLQQEFASAGHQRFHEENERNLIKESGGVDAGVVGEAVSVLCRDGQCSSGTMRRRLSRVSKEAHHRQPVFHEDYSGRSRKFENFSTSSTSTYSKSVKNGGGTEFSVESPPVSGHGEVALESYPDVIDIAEMDYSPATRKSPIHN